MSYAHDDDTIVAPITPPGHSGVGVIRISGDRALPILEGLSRWKGRSIEERRVTLMRIFETESGLPIDRVLVTLFRSPNSYTGEDVVEISSHGNPVIMTAICDGAIALGARMAEPGEFTKRSFLNGKMDLSQAEAVQEVIMASTMLAAKAAQKRLEGGLTGAVMRVRESLIEALVHLEAAVDFPEEELEIFSEAKILSLLSDALGGVDDLVDSFRVGRILSEGANIAIVGKPNVGKSSLLNCFLREERAIVSPQPGTTRDFITGVMHIRGIPLKVIDTAGIRAGNIDALESEGVGRSRKIIENADLVLFVVDGNSALTEEDDVAHAEIEGRTFIVIPNKSDLGIIDYGDRYRGSRGWSGCVPVSAKMGDGIGELEKTVYKAMMGEDWHGSLDVLVGNLRQKEKLERARGYIDAAIRGLSEDMPPELVALEAKDAASSLGEIVGEITTEDILERIFQSFCIGK